MNREVSSPARLDCLPQRVFRQIVSINDNFLFGFSNLATTESRCDLVCLSQWFPLLSSDQDWVLYNRLPGGGRSKVAGLESALRVGLTAGWGHRHVTGGDDAGGGGGRHPALV